MEQEKFKSAKEFEQGTLCNFGMKLIFTIIFS